MIIFLFVMQIFIFFWYLVFFQCSISFIITPVFLLISIFETPILKKLKSFKKPFFFTTY
jgi:hypothetical protein